jgi:hypothetical protein
MIIIIFKSIDYCKYSNIKLVASCGLRVARRAFENLSLNSLRLVIEAFIKKVKKGTGQKVTTISKKRDRPKS